MAKEKATKAASTASPKKSSSKKASGRFLGWQLTPIQQASFGRTTKGGRKNDRFAIKHSTGPVQEQKKLWYVLDASEAPVGRLASVAAAILMGKHRSTFTPGAGSGDAVIVINAEKAFFTANKAEKKIYYWHTQFMGGLKSETGRQALEKHPDQVIWQAVQGMLPKNKLSRYQLALLKVVTGPEHKQSAQKPIKISLKYKGMLKNIKSKSEAA